MRRQHKPISQQETEFLDELRRYVLNTDQLPQLATGHYELRKTLQALSQTIFENTRLARRTRRLEEARVPE